MIEYSIFFSIAAIALSIYVIMDKFCKVESKPTENLHSLIFKLYKMSETVANEFSQKLDLLNGRLDNIQADVTKIKDELPSEGGMTADEVALVRAKLDVALNKAAGIDDQTPNETTEQPAQ